MLARSKRISAKAIDALSAAARDAAPVSGWTHNFYRYPARFSPQFAAAAIRHFSKPDDVILDPYMGGGTSVVEALVAGRQVVGNDLNSLAIFVTKVKSTPLKKSERVVIREWASEEVPNFQYRQSMEPLAEYIDNDKVKNLSLARARFLKKIIAAALASISKLPTTNTRRFAKCVVLRAGQWALDGRSCHTSVAEFRTKLLGMTDEMLAAINLFADRLKSSDCRAWLLNVDAAELDKSRTLRENPVNLVVTSPPYPGVHMLYHRWQVDGRRETPAPYWISGCNDGEGASFYNFGDRRQSASDNYFQKSLATLQAIRAVMRENALMIQMIAFNNPDEQLPRYLQNMDQAGFREVRDKYQRRIRRDVPSRRWHANLKGKLPSAREVVLIHQAS
ncbi:MAG: DNA methyltransferase [Phycisphaerae bacterium]